MHRFKLLVLTGLVVACLADETSKLPTNDPKKAERTTESLGVKTPHLNATKSMGEGPMASMKDSGGHDGGKHGDGVKHDEGVKLDDGVKHEDGVKPKIVESSGAEDMKSSATVGLGFYGGVVPLGYPSYPVYQPYRYYQRPYWSPRSYWGGYGYSYRPIPVIVKTRPVPVLLG